MENNNDIIFIDPHFIKWKDKIYRCSIGFAGISKIKKEGDGVTPSGIFRLLNVYYRYDRINKPETVLNCIKIKPNYFWCDDPKSTNYNRLVFNRDTYSAEKLFRTDEYYDILIEISHNSNPIIKGKGSAIFIHCTSNKYPSTEGCVGLLKKDLLKILEELNASTRLIIK